MQHLIEHRVLVNETLILLSQFFVSIVVFSNLNLSRPHKLLQKIVPENAAIRRFIFEGGCKWFQMNFHICHICHDSYFVIQFENRQIVCNLYECSLNQMKLHISQFRMFAVIFRRIFNFSYSISASAHKHRVIFVQHYSQAKTIGSAIMYGRRLKLGYH